MCPKKGTNQWFTLQSYSGDGIRTINPTNFRERSGFLGKHQQIVRSASLSNQSVWYMYVHYWKWWCLKYGKTYGKTTLKTHTPALCCEKRQERLPAVLLCSNLTGYDIYSICHIVSSPQKRHVGWKAKINIKKETTTTKKGVPWPPNFQIFWHHWTWKNTLPALKKNRHLFRDDFAICPVGNLGSSAPLRLFSEGKPSRTPQGPR